MSLRKAGPSRRFSRLMLPGMAALVLLAVITWILWCLSVVPNGKLTPGTVLLILGFAGAPLTTLFLIAGAIPLIENAIVDARETIIEEVRQAMNAEERQP